MNHIGYMQGFITLSCLIAVSVNFSTFLVIGKTSPVTYQVLGHLKTCLVLAFGYTLLHDPFTPRNIAGILIAVLGMLLYSYFCSVASKSKQGSSESAFIVRNHTQQNENIESFLTTFINCLILFLFLTGER